MRLKGVRINRRDDYRPTMVKALLSLLALVGFATPALAWAGDAQTTIDQIQSDSSYQTAFQPLPQAPPPSEPNWLTRSLYWLAHSGSGVLNILVIILIIAVVIAILYVTVPAVRDMIDGFRRRFKKSARAADEVAVDEAWRPDAEQARDLLTAADALAREQRYAEAARLLLIRSVEDITRKRPGILRPAFTARAIALLDELPVTARAAFGRVGAVVERGIWAGRPLGEPDWLEARNAYQDFAFGGHWRGAAS